MIDTDTKDTRAPPSAAAIPFKTAEFSRTEIKLVTKNLTEAKSPESSTAEIKPEIKLVTKNLTEAKSTESSTAEIKQEIKLVTKKLYGGKIA